MSTLADDGQNAYRRWGKAVYAAIHGHIGPEAGGYQGDGRYQNVVFGHSMAYGKAGNDGYVQLVVTLTGNSPSPGRHRNTTYQWRDESDVARVARELVNLYADLRAAV
jgi:hypothetical protein